MIGLNFEQMKRWDDLLIMANDEQLKYMLVKHTSEILKRQKRRKEEAEI